MRDFFIQGARRQGKKALLLAGLAMEDLVDGKMRVERELCFVAKLADVSLLSQAVDVCQQWQYGLSLPPEPYRSVVMRVRRESREQQGSQDILTLKATKLGESFPYEASVEAPQGLFEVYQAIQATKGCFKHRYSFPTGRAEGELWEIDTFNHLPTQPPDELKDWVKIDLEMKVEDQPLPAFPIGLVDVIDIKTADPEKKAFVDRLFKEFFFRDPRQKQAA